MPRKRRRPPQEKKRLSYRKDRRNWYGVENDKSSRKNIARNKRHRIRAERHRENQLLVGATGVVSPEAGELVQDRVSQRRHGRRWRKRPDRPLGLTVIYTLERRVRKGISVAETEQARIRKVRQNTRPRTQQVEVIDPP